MIGSDPVGAIYTGDKSDSLEEILHGIVDEQERLLLLQRLQARGLYTRDILSFIKNQAELRTTDKHLDHNTA